MTAVATHQATTGRKAAATRATACTKPSSRAVLVPMPYRGEKARVLTVKAAIPAAISTSRTTTAGCHICPPGVAIGGSGRTAVLHKSSRSARRTARAAVGTRRPVPALRAASSPCPTPLSPT